MKMRVIACLQAAVVAGTLVQAQDNTVVGKPAWVSSPSAVRQASGKFPGTVNVVLFLNACSRNAAGTVTNPLDVRDTYRITPTGTGMSAGAVVVGSCTLTTTITIDSQSAQPGYQYLMVSREAVGAGPFLDAGFSLFAMLDPLAGPTPSTPEVDVQWKVLSQHACSDTFGNHVAKVFYCVQVTIGNNSAHSLQLAGIGFKTPNPLAGVLSVPSDSTIVEPNVSYRTSRAVAQNGQSTSFRNILVDSVQGVGLIMSSFTPYFHNARNSTRWSTGSAIVSGALLQAIGLVAPDLSIRELNNLDDEALRDGKLIPNNTQASPVSVFVDKTDVSDALAAMEINISKLSTKTVGQQTLLSDLENCLKKDDCGPIPVKIALGDLVIVGDQVDYVQRIVVNSSVTSQEVAATPFISNSSGLSAASGATTNLVIVGTGLDKIIGSPTLDPTSIAGSVTIGAISVSGTTSATVPITVPGAYHGPVTLHFKGPSGPLPPVIVTIP